ncbi:MAG: two-component system response regulator [Terriglobia bacterium]
MAGRSVFALCAYERAHPLEALKAALRAHSIEMCSAKTCEEVERLLSQTQPELIFTDTILPDGSWADIVRLAENSPAPANVVVVGACADTKLYISAMEHGAFDFILPPFEEKPLTHVLQVAVENVRRRRGELAVKAVA